MSEERERFLETLRAAHEFPLDYTFKLIGDNDSQLLDKALEALEHVLPEAQPQVTRRESGKGNHQSITLVVNVPQAEVVHDLYERFRDIPGMRMLL